MQYEPLITKSEIRQMSNATYYKRGEKYYEQGRVSSLQQSPGTEAEAEEWTATVRGSQTYAVRVTIDEAVVKSSCTCPVFDPYSPCKHVVAVLLAVADQTDLDGQTSTLMPPWANIAAASLNTVTKDPHEGSKKLVDIFRKNTRGHTVSGGSPGTDIRPGMDTREYLQVEFLCETAVSHYRGDSLLLQMKVGPKYTYVVKRIRDFLDVVEKQKQHVFTKRFTYDPAQYRFQAADLAVLGMLQEIRREEAFYSTLINPYSTAGRGGRDDRTLQIPPSMWKSLYPRLLEAGATMHRRGLTGPLQVLQEKPPIAARVESHSSDTYSLRFDGLDEVTLLPDYGCAAVGTTLYELDESALQQISDLKRVLVSERDDEINIPVDALDPVISEVVPALKKIADVQVDKTISNRVVEEPLTANLYLDRHTAAAQYSEAEADVDVLTAHVEYVYGGEVIYPFAAKSVEGEYADDDERDRIVVRDFAQEKQIERFLIQSAFQVDGQALALTGEEQIYNFLFHHLSQLQEWVNVYATAAVDNWLASPSTTPHSRLELDTESNWLEVSFDMSNVDENEIMSVLQAMVEKKKYHRLRDGRFLSLEDDSFSSISRVLEDLDITPYDLAGALNAHPLSGKPDDEQALGLRLPALRALPLIELEQRTGTVKMGKSLRRWLDNLRNPDHLDASIPSGLKATLRPYQEFGFQWMKTLSEYGFGGILADDMGLGKTIQTITYLLSDLDPSEGTDSAGYPAKDQSLNHAALIVCPASLTFNWLKEIQTFAPELKAAVLSGDKQEREDILKSTGLYDVVITSYPLLWRDVNVYQEQQFSTLILDEAQAVKNPNTRTAKAVQAIHSDRRFALTGTPVENSLGDLWSIFRAVFPQLLGERKSFSELSPEQVAKRIRPFVLRRLKQDVLKELPDKIETLQTAELTKEQKEHYMAYLTQLQNDTKEGLASEGFQKRRFRILAGLTRLRQICCHPSLCVENYTGSSGKLNQLMELVEEYLAANQRILIFSQFTSMLELIRREIVSRKLRYFYLDGQTPSAKRLELCQEFNEGDVPVFLISLKAGGTGLNLTGADTVILYDLWWNPAVEQQAADRAHRIGQKRTVQVIRMVTHGTIEEKMYQLQQRKRDLIDTVVQANDEGLNALTEEDVRQLLTI